MALILAVMAITILAAIFIPPYLNPSHDEFQTAVSTDSGFGFAMSLTLNSTAVQPLGHLALTAWLNSTSDSIQNITSQESWTYPQSGLWTLPCIGGWPIGIGVMEGHYTEDNYTLGTLLPLNPPDTKCLASSPPQYLLLYPHSSEAQASINGSLSPWLLRMEFTFGEGSLAQNALPASQKGSGLPQGVYTVVLADEWGDVLTASFQVT